MATASTRYQLCIERHHRYIAHLGSGASVTAVKHGQSIDTSMGLTPSGGVMMGTRSGDIDPGVLTYLMREKKYDSAMIAAMLDQRAGLLGVSGISGDMRRLHDAAAPDAQLAIAMFCYSVAKAIAAMIVALDGIDLLVFSGGIGEHDARVRAQICTHLRCVGVGVDEERNLPLNNPIRTAASACAVRVLPSQENEQIARNVCGLLA